MPRSFALIEAVVSGGTRRLDKGQIGSVFGGRGSVVGVTADTFQDDDRVKNALVR